MCWKQYCIIYSKTSLSTDNQNETKERKKQTTNTGHTKESHDLAQHDITVKQYNTSGRDFISTDNQPHTHPHTPKTNKV